MAKRRNAETLRSHSWCQALRLHFSDGTTGDQQPSPAEGGSGYTGRLVANLGPDLHRSCAEAARVRDLTLAQWMQLRLREAVVRDLEG